MEVGLIIAVWLALGAWVAVLVGQVAHQERVTLHWGWWPVLIVFGPITPLLALGAELWRRGNRLGDRI
jgi:hypothetical protein